VYQSIKLKSLVCLLDPLMLTNKLMSFTVVKVAFYTRQSYTRQKASIVVVNSVALSAYKNMAYFIIIT